MDTFDHIRLLVAEGQLREALAALLNEKPLEQNAIVMLQSRLSTLEKSELNGTADPRDAALERNRIALGLLELCKNLGSASSDAATAAQPTSPVQYRLANIVQFLKNGLSDAELDELCLIHFDAVYQTFAAGQSKQQKINQLVDYCKRQLRFGELLEAMQGYNPAQFEQYQPYRT